MAVLTLLGLGLGLAGLVSCKPRSGPGQPAAAATVESPEALLDQVRYLQAETTQWYVVFGLESDGQWAPKLVAITPDKKRLENRVSAAAMLKPGDVFFTVKEPFMNRFRFTGIVKKEVLDERTQSKEMVYIAQYEDLKPNKSGTKYESQFGLPDARIQANAYYDRTAVLDIAQAGGERRKLKVEENSSFTLPSAAGEKSFLLKEVTDDAIVIEYGDDSGGRKLRSVPRLKES